MSKLDPWISETTAYPVNSTARWRQHQVTARGLAFVAGDGCKRCVLTTIDPGTSIRHAKQEPLRTSHPLAGAGNERPISGSILFLKPAAPFAKAIDCRFYERRRTRSIGASVV